MGKLIIVLLGSGIIGFLTGLAVMAYRASLANPLYIFPMYMVLLAFAAIGLVGWAVARTITL